jgi:hypothetical protein
LRSFVWSGKQCADIDIPTKVGESGGNNASASVMTILTEFRNKHSRSTPLALRKGFDSVEGLIELSIRFCRRAVIA